MKLNSKKYDVLGVGFGPANIALAIALEELIPHVNIKFIEAREQTMWQSEMLIDGSDIQNSPLRDLVTPRNPRSKYTFINYLHQQERLFEYLNLGIVFPLRKEYQQYIKWVANHFEHWVDYNQRVTSIETICNEDSFEELYSVRTDCDNTYFGKVLVVAPGRTPYIPSPFDKVESDRIFHLTKYLTSISRWEQKLIPKRVGVVGSSQSAVELMIDLSNRFSQAEIVGLTRSFGYRLKDTSPFTGEVFFPKFVDYYYHASNESKKQLNQDLRYTNYSSVDADVLNQLYLKIYEQKLDGNKKILIKNNCLITNVLTDPDKIVLSTFEKNLKQKEEEEFDLIILATGFRNLGSQQDEEVYPPILQSIKSRLPMNEQGYLDINYDYSVELIDKKGSPATLFINGLCESSHGMGDAGSFSLLSLRAATIADALKRGLGMSLDYSTSVSSSHKCEGNNQEKALKN